MNDPSTVPWNVQLPSFLEKKVLSCIEAPSPQNALGALVEEYPHLAKHIVIWAEQAVKFRGVEQLRERDRYSPEVIGPYRVIQKLGAGGFGSVFLGKRSENERPVAIKVLLHNASDARLRIEQEVEILAELDHPTIVDVYDFGESQDGRLYYVMDFIPGCVLDSFFYRDTFSNEDFLATLLQICDALSYMHRKGVIHRDIKPANMLVDIVYDVPHAHLVDFGLASQHRIQPTSRFRMAKAGRLFEQSLRTPEGGVVGTPAFMSPEQLLDPATVDRRADVYSLGVTLYLLLTGQFPIPPEEILEALGVNQLVAYDTLMTTRIASLTETLATATEPRGDGRGRLRNAQRVMSQLSRRQRQGVDEIVLGCLEKSPENRVDDALELGERLAWAFGMKSGLRYIPGRIWGGIKSAASRLIPKRDPEKQYSEDHRSQVWFVTDRRPDMDDKGFLTFGPEEADEVTFGYSAIGLPKWRALGRLKPGWWEWLWGNRQYSVIKHLRVERDEFASQVSEAADGLGVLLFVHGYNTSFDQAVVRAAQLQIDLKMNGRVICYSWPSMGRVHGYGADAAIVEQSEKHVMDTIRLLTGLSSSPFVHVMGHSMGNRALLRGVARLNESGKSFVLAQVILAAPDVGQGLFKDLCGAYVSHAKRCTLYASKHDRALMGSRFLHARGRAGYIPPIMVIDGIDTIDVSRIGFRLWGLNHSAFGDCREIISDIAALIWQDLPPEHRIGIERQIDPDTGKAYWVCIQ
jgi:serine/threonine protein kinase/pimeloyl-ACP methyl ester carboxylesterase